MGGVRRGRVGGGGPGGRLCVCLSVCLGTTVCLSVCLSVFVVEGERGAVEPVALVQQGEMRRQ